MKEIKTIGDLKKIGLLKGLYSGIRKYYEKQHEPIYRCNQFTDFRYVYDPGAYIFGGSCSIERNGLLKEPVSYLKTIDFSKINNFGHGKKEAQMKMIFELLGFEWR